MKQTKPEEIIKKQIEKSKQAKARCNTIGYYLGGKQKNRQ